jgi:hypothetical protein
VLALQLPSSAACALLSALAFTAPLSPACTLHPAIALDFVFPSLRLTFLLAFATPTHVVLHLMPYHLPQPVNNVRVGFFHTIFSSLRLAPASALASASSPACGLRSALAFATPASLPALYICVGSSIAIFRSLRLTFCVGICRIIFSSLPY